MKSKSSALQPAILLLLVLILSALYSGTLSVPFVFDDNVNIVLNPSVRLQDFSWKGIHSAIDLSPNKLRLLPNLSFGLNYYFSGFDVFGFHLVNIAIHIAAAFIFYLLAATTLQLSPRFRELRTAEIAFAAALLWAVHPLQTNGVTYIVQRMTSMATLFCLLAIYSYARARLAQNGYRKTMLLGFAILFFIMALFSKENSGMLPILILGYEFFFLQGKQIGAGNSRKLLLPTLGLLLLFVLICLLFLGDDPLARLLGGYNSRNFTLGQRLLTEPRVIIHYLSLLFLPLPARLNLAYDFPLSTGIISPVQTMLAILALASLTAIIFPLYQKNRLAAFAIFWLLINLVIESSVIPLEIIFEHRMYMPAMFPLLIITAEGYRVAAGRVDIARSVAIATVILLSLSTWQRNSVWRTEISLWTDVVQKAPQLARGYVNLGKAYELQNNHITAEKLLQKAIKLAPLESRAYVNLGRVLERQGRFSEALEILQQGLKTKRPDKANLYNNIAVVYIRLQEYENAVQYAKMAEQINPYMADPYINHGIALGSMGNHQAAADLFRKAVETDPDNGEALVRLGTAYDKLDMPAEALVAFQQSLTKKQANRAKTFFYIGRMYRKLGNYSAAVEASEKALQLDPNFSKPLLTIGIAHEEAGLYEKASSAYRRAWQNGINMIRIFNDWAAISMQSGQTDRALYYLQQAVKLDPAFPETHEKLAKLFTMRGHPEKAALHRSLAERYRSNPQNTQSP